MVGIVHGALGVELNAIRPGWPDFFKLVVSEPKAFAGHGRIGFGDRTHGAEAQLELGA